MKLKMPLPKVSKKGFVLPNDGDEILLLHGFTGTPYDLKPLGIALNELGFHINAPLLLGHGASSKKIATVQAEEWIFQAQQAFKELSGKKKKVIIGISMGTFLATLLAKKFKVDALIFISPSFKLRFSGEVLLQAVNLGILPKDGFIRKLEGQSDIADPKGKKLCPSNAEISLFGLLQFLRLRKMAFSALNEVYCPIFCAFGKRDAVINIEASRLAVEMSSSPQIVFKTYNRSKHVLTLDFDREKLLTDIVDFLNHNL